MKKATPLNAKIFTLLIVFLAGSMSIVAQDYAVKPLSDFLQTYKEKHSVISQELEQQNNIEFSKKLAIYESKISELKETFKAERKSEYELKTVKRAKRHSCKGTRIRGVTDCGAVYIKAPNSNMYTKEDWIKLEGTDKATAEVLDDNSISLKMTATGTRENKSVLYTVFKYKPELIAGIVEKETDKLFNQVMDK